MFRKYIKKFVPPVFIDLMHLGKNSKDLSAEKPDLVFSHDYENWELAKKDARGYDQQIILEQVFSAVSKVKNGEAAYERDGVIFDSVQYSWPVVSFLLKAALENDGKLSVLDFGGSLGSSYFQNRDILSLGESLTWNVIEQKHFVDKGKAALEDDSLRFYYDIESCLVKDKPDVLLLSGILQYLDKPYDWISVFNQLSVEYIIIDRTAFTSDGRELIKIQRNSESADYPTWFFDKQKLLQSFNNYKLVCEFQDNTTSPVVLNNSYGYWSGAILSAS